MVSNSEIDGGELMERERRRAAEPAAVAGMMAVDLVSEARWKVLAVDVLVEHLVTTAQESGPRLDERIMVLIYAAEGASKEALASMERARGATDAIRSMFGDP